MMSKLKSLYSAIGLTLCVCLCLSVCPILGLYDDQVGKFDWVQRYVGPVQHAVFDQSSSPSRRLIVSTGQNVVAALSTKTGDILWRHVLETSEFGKVEVLHSQEHYVSIVIGNLVRTWDVITAALREEIVLDLSPKWPENHLSHIFGFGTNNEDLFLAAFSVENLQVTVFDGSSGATVTQREFPGSWIQADTRCAMAGNVLSCLDLLGDSVHWVDMTARNSSLAQIPLSSFGVSEVTRQEGAANPASVSISKLAGTESHLLIKIGSKKKLVHAHRDGLHLVKDVSDVQAVAVEGDMLYTITQSLMTLTLQAIELSTGAEVAERSVVIELPAQSGAVQGAVVHSFARKDGGVALRAFVACSDHSVHLFGSAGVIWSREEALSQILSVEAVDLPIAGAAATYHDQLSFDAGLLSGLFHRLKSQAWLVIGKVNSLVGGSDEMDRGSRPALTRDQFNTRKLMVIVTSSGKVLALDTWTGEVIWSLFVPMLSPFKNQKILLFTMRSAAHFPRSPQCVITGRHKATGEGLLLVFNPLTGEPLGHNGGAVLLGYSLLHASLLHQTDEDYIKPLLLIDEDRTPHVFPPSGERVLLRAKDSLYVHLALPTSPLFNGYALRNSKPGKLRLDEVWSVAVSGGGGVVSGVHAKRAGEKVHSQGRVLADRSVLYKYSNPNLVVVTSFGQDSLSKNTLWVHLVDTVTGSVLESVTHKRVSGPFHVVHSENWVVYTTYSEKFRRHEVTALELFEGLDQSNVSAFSSLGARATPPIVERQAFILPQGVMAAGHTTTEKGITTKFILFALNTGNVLQMSKWFLDPRRPLSQGGPREEGLIPYMPELPLPPQEMINHNHTLPRVSAIFTSPTGLESTCLVLVYGLDVFYTRLFPSKMFDVLKDDFDHYLIVGVLVSLTSAALITRKLSQRKALKQAWK